MQQFSMLVGAVVIARASDPDLARDVLAAASAAIG
jgi:TetR/AcrR family transcriptional repressor of nem operon